MPPFAITDAALLHGGLPLHCTGTVYGPVPPELARSGRLSSLALLFVGKGLAFSKSPRRYRRLMPSFETRHHALQVSLTAASPRGRPDESSPRTNHSPSISQSAAAASSPPRRRPEYLGPLGRGYGYLDCPAPAARAPSTPYLDGPNNRTSATWHSAVSFRPNLFVKRRQHGGVGGPGFKMDCNCSTLNMTHVNSHKREELEFRAESVSASSHA